MENIQDLNGHEMDKGEEKHVTNLAGDASGQGGYLGVLTHNKTLLSVPFSPEERGESSTMRELLVLHKYYMNNNLQQLRGLVIVHYCDNKGVEAIMVKESPKDYLHNLARDIFVTTRQAGVNLLVEWR